MTTVYCGNCGVALSQSAKFCRACGSAQETTYAAAAGYPPAPEFQASPTAFVAAPAQSLPATELLAAILAIVGGAAICFIALYATFYLPLHHRFSVNYGESVRIGDVLALGSGLVAIAIGVLLLIQHDGNRGARAVWLLVAGTPTLILALLWSFPETFHLSLFPVPFYFAYVYFTDLGVVQIGSGYVPLPLVAACAMVIGAGLAILAPAANRAMLPGPR